MHHILLSSSSSPNSHLNTLYTHHVRFNKKKQKKKKKQRNLHQCPRQYKKFSVNLSLATSSRSCDTRSTIAPASPDFNVEPIKASVWLTGQHNISGEASRTASHSLPRLKEEGEDCNGDHDDSTFCMRTGITNEAHEEAIIYRLKDTSNDCQTAQDDPHTLVTSLKACAKEDVHRGNTLHAVAVRMGLLETNIFVGSTLVSMYAKCGMLAKAHEVFEKLPVRNVVSWSALIAGYAQHGDGKQALKCFEQMQLMGISPNAVTFVSILKACGSIGSVDKGEEIHSEIIRCGSLEDDIVVGSALIDLYVKFGLLGKAQEVFDKLPSQNTVSWCTLLAGYAQQGHGEEALKCFECMQHEGLSPDAVTFVCILKACGSIGALEKGQQIHASIVRTGLFEKNDFVGNALVDMFAKCGLLAQAQQLFDKLPNQSVISWTALIAGYVEHGHGEQALDCFELMQLEGLSPNAVTFVCVLKACGSIKAVERGQEIHAEIARKGSLENDVVVGSALVDMYAKCGLLEKAQDLFDKILLRNVVLWSTLIAGYAQHGYCEQALRCFDRMQLDGVSPNAVTFASILKACGCIGAIAKGRQIHTEIVKHGLLGSDFVVGSALIDMYANCGLLAKAEAVFGKFPVRNEGLWSTLMAGYVQHGHGEQALDCFEQMQKEIHSLDAVTFACILKACGSTGAADKGQYIHAQIIRRGLLESNMSVGHALVDMYAKCGLLATARELLDKLLVRNVVSWSALLTGYGLLGDVESVFCLFDEMSREGIVPDLVIFIVVLSACSHAGQLENGQLFFEAMSIGYGMMPTLEHHICMVDLLGRAGHLDKALAVIESMPFSADLIVWLTMLGACQKWGNVKLGRIAFDHALQLDKNDAIAYVGMSNLYAHADCCQTGCGLGTCVKSS